VPYPASTKTLQTWVALVDQKAVQVKAAAQTQSTLSSANNLTAEHVRLFTDLLIEANNLFIAASAVPGIAAYLNTEKQGTVADPVAEFTAMRSAVVATLDWLRANVPGGSFIGADGNLAYKHGFHIPTNNTSPTVLLRFTAAQTAGYRTQLTALVATIT
jgi:hypothetical protein